MNTLNIKYVFLICYTARKVHFIPYTDPFVCLYKKQTPNLQDKKTFGGFKKGFLNNPKPRKGKPSPSSNSLKKDDDIPIVKPKNPEENNRGMELPEVQEAMKSNIPSLENKGHCQ